MKRLLKVAGGIMLILFFSPAVIVSIGVAAIAIPGYRVEPGFMGRVLGVCFLFGLPGLFACMVGGRLLRQNLSKA